MRTGELAERESGLTTEGIHPEDTGLSGMPLYPEGRRSRPDIATLPHSQGQRDTRVLVGFDDFAKHPYQVRQISEIEPLQHVREVQGGVTQVAEVVQVFFAWLPDLLSESHRPCPKPLFNAKLLYTLSFSPDEHFKNVLKMLQFHARTNHNLLAAPVNRTAWVTTPAVVNAYYSRSKNMIVFPAGILQPPFYHPAFPKSLNYGGIGVVIGHEITHGFDDRGRQFDKNGNLNQWWKPEDVSKFYQRASCMLGECGEAKEAKEDLGLSS
ncbi:putative endothelin-converting enzyme 1-like isoform X3 [Penaeus vannamei]|uniref:Putative endothelin-converting enzyme 1-like isoform X3 n=1 Tax=Penaeus vannamei TaxID=6689 RepID=A0A3R7PL63_PENVA|nr:putative endothelin-converting enzyme 1-like isoform X3 [Penaeus vannamei]